MKHFSGMKELKVNGKVNCDVYTYLENKLSNNGIPIISLSHILKANRLIRTMIVSIEVAVKHAKISTFSRQPIVIGHL